MVVIVKTKKSHDNLNYSKMFWILRFMTEALHVAQPLVVVGEVMVLNPGQNNEINSYLLHRIIESFPRILK